MKQNYWKLTPQYFKNELGLNVTQDEIEQAEQRAKAILDGISQDANPQNWQARKSYR